MGIENFGEKIKVASTENYEVELQQREKEVMKKIKVIFQENAELNKLLLNEEDLDLSEHQIHYLVGQLAGFRRDIQGVIKDLRNAVPLPDKKAA